MAADVSGPTIQRAEFSADHEEAVEQFVRETYVDNRLRFLSFGADAHFGARTASGPEIAIDEIRSTVDYSATIDPLDYLLFIGLRGGRVICRNGREEALVGPGEPALWPLGVDLSFDAFELDAMFLRLSRERLQRAAAELGATTTADFRVEGTAPVSPAMARTWFATMVFADGTMLDDDLALAEPLLIEELTRTVATTALHAFPNSLMRNGKVRSRSAATPSALRRALAFVEANADTPVTITDIAAAAGVTPRALQYGFRRHLDTSPLGYLRRVRLEAAHNDLLDADGGEGVTVAEIARRWGFAKPGRFSVYYRETYGRPPSKTLGG